METFKALILVNMDTLKDVLLVFIPSALVVGILLVSFVYLIGVVINFGYKLFSV